MMMMMMMLMMMILLPLLSLMMMTQQCIAGMASSSSSLSSDIIIKDTFGHEFSGQIIDPLSQTGIFKCADGRLYVGGYHAGMLSGRGAWKWTNGGPCFEGRYVCRYLHAVLR